MTDFVKYFIKQHEAEINNNEWKKLYKADKWADHYPEIGLFTEMLLESGIDPLEDLDYIPAFYLLGCGGLHEITIPEHITKIDRLAFSGAHYLQRIYIPKSVTKIGINAFLEASDRIDNTLEIIYEGTYEEWQAIDKHPQVNLPRFYKLKTKDSKGWIR